MASELIVQTLKGPTSGANANKVIIPSGQTLDASAGGFTPASGQIVNHEYYTNNTYVNNSTETFADLWSVTYTPVLTQSLIYFMWSCDIRTSRSGGADTRAHLRTVVDGAGYANNYDMSHYDYGNSGAWHHMMVAVTSFKNNTDGSATTHVFQGRTAGGAEVGISITATNTSYLHVMEIAG